jgi:hypothetical protein
MTTADARDAEAGGAAEAQWPGSDARGRLKEYELLRTEILQADRLVVQVLGIALAGVSVVLAQGFVCDEPLIFLVPYPLLAVAGLYVADKRWLVWLIASYLRSRLESEGAGPLWETRLARYRDLAAKRRVRFSPATNVILVEFLLFNAMGVTCSVLYFAHSWPAGSPLEPWQIVLSACLPAAMLALLTSLLYVPLLREGVKRRLDDLWGEAG